MPRAEYKVQTAALMAAECYTKKNLRGKLYKISSFLFVLQLLKETENAQQRHISMRNVIHKKFGKHFDNNNKLCYANDKGGVRGWTIRNYI